MKKYMQPRAEAVCFHAEAPLLSASVGGPTDKRPDVDDENNLFSGSKGWNSSDWADSE